MPINSGNAIEKENEIVDNRDNEVKYESDKQSESTNYDKIYEILKSSQTRHFQSIMN